MVLTNFHALRDKSEELRKVEWRRLVLDEAQAINNRKNGFEQACEMRAEHKWSLSGTPVKNRLRDLQPHLELIGAASEGKKGRQYEAMAEARVLHGVALRRTGDFNVQQLTNVAWVFANEDQKDAEMWP